MSKYNTVEAITALSTPDPELVAVLQSLPQPDPTVKPTFEQILQQARDGAHAGEQAAYNACPTLGVRETTRAIPMRDGFESEIRVFQPAESSTPAGPLVIMIFGGGFIAGSNVQYTPFSRLFATLFGATVVNLSYRLAPENKFPVASHDVWDSMVWIADHAQELGAKPESGFVVGGGSAGANLALANVQKWQESSKSPALTGVFANIPVFLDPKTVPKEYEQFFLSRKQNAEAPILNQAAFDMFAAAYQQDVFSTDFSPINAASPFSAFPPTYIQVDGLDLVRDDGLILARILEKNNIATRLDVYPGVPHGHQANLPQLTQSKKMSVDTIYGVGWLLGKEVSEEDLKIARKFFADRVERM